MAHYPFELTPLPYGYGDLEPYIDARTVEIHHDRHLKTYVNNLNKALENYPEYHSWSLEKLIRDVNWLPEDIRVPVARNAGGVYNHNFYFANMAPYKEGNAPSGELLRLINQSFGNYDTFKSQFKEKALSVFGSGYAWLVLENNGNLKIITTANQDTPLTLGVCPVLTIDVWEHAYYLKHQNLRANYIDDWFNVVNFDEVNDNLIACE